MIEYIRFGASNFFHALILILKWFLFSIVAEVAAIIGLLALLIPPGIMIALVDAIGLPGVVAAPIAILAFVGSGVAFGALMKGHGEVFSFNVSGTNHRDEQ